MEVNRVQEILNAIAAQRNQALDAAAMYQADLVVANARIAELEAATERLAALEAKIAALEAAPQP